MKKYITGLFVFGLIVSCAGVSGCGGNVSTEDKNAKEAVSGRAVSETAVVNQGKRQNKGRYCTDTNLYTQWRRADVSFFEKEGIPEEEWGDYLCPAIAEIVQMRLDGSCKKRIDLGELPTFLIGVSGNWLYYMTYEDEDDDKGEYEPIKNTGQIFRVPIQKGTDGYDELNKEKAELLISKEQGGAKAGCITYVDENYLFYTRYRDYEYQLVKYDLKNQKEIELDDGGTEDDFDAAVTLGDKYIFISETESYAVQVHSEGGNWDYVASDRYMMWDDLWACNDRFLFYECIDYEEDDCEYSPGPDYMERDIIRAYDGEKNHTLVTRKELKKAVEEAAKGMENMTADELEDWELANLLCDDDRCYIEVQISGTHDGSYRISNLLLSKSPEDKKIRIEKNIMQRMREYEREWVGRWCVKEKKQRKVIKEKSVVNPVHVRNIKNGKLYFYYHNKENKLYLECYEIESGRTYDVTIRDEAFYERYYDEIYEEEYEGDYDWDEEPVSGDGFGYEDMEGIMDMIIFPDWDAYFEEVSADGQKK